MKKYILIILIFLFLISGCEQKIIIVCKLDSDCVPASCCHPTSCIIRENKPDCKGVMCTMECKSETMDCGQGGCKCVNNKCEAVFN